MTKTSHNLIMNSLEELKAVDTKILSLKDISSFTDIMIITSGTSSRHMSAISDKIQENLKEKSIPIISVEGKGSSEWVLLDLGDIVVNIMSKSCLLYTSPSPRDDELSRMPSSA